MELHRIIGHFLMKHFAGKRQPVIDSGKKHIACIGDSITYGNGVGGKKELTWEFLLNEIFGDEYQVINYGASGRTLQKEGDFPYVDDPICQYSRQCQAEMYIIMLGTNDAKHFNWNRKRYEEQYRQFAQSYLDLPGRPKVVLMIPPCCYPDPLSGIVAFFVDRQVIDLQLPEIIRQTGEEMGLPVIDLHELTAGHPEWFADGVHPNAEGNRAIAQAIASLLNP